MEDAAVFRGHAEVRAGILITGTEVLTGIISDRNGPWLTERLRETGVDVARIVIVGDRPDDMRRALAQMAADGLALVVTSGGLGPTADDLTAEIVGEFCGREMVLDARLDAVIAEILKPFLKHGAGSEPDAVLAANRKQAVIPAGATVIDPVGTAPGLLVPAAAGREGPTVVVLPGPPRELQAMWSRAVKTTAFAEAITGAVVYQREMMRMFGVPESDIAQTLRAAAAAGISLADLEITTCLRRGELELSTRLQPSAKADYAELVAFIEERHGDAIFSRDGTTIDEQLAALLLEHGATIATAESCTGGLLAARLTDRPGASEYVLGGAVVYSNEAKSAIVGVSERTLSLHGAVSPEVARELARGARETYGAAVGIGVTGIAGPGGGSEDKPVGTVCFAVAYGRAGAEVERMLERRSVLPGDRAAVRDRASTVAMHLIAALLRGEPA